MEKEDNRRQRREQNTFCQLSGSVSPCSLNLHSPAGCTPNTPESMQGLTLSPIARPPKCPGSLLPSYWQLTSLDLSSFYFLQSLPPVLEFHLKDLILSSIFQLAKIVCSFRQLQVLGKTWYLLQTVTNQPGTTLLPWGYHLSKCPAPPEIAS